MRPLERAEDLARRSLENIVDRNRRRARLPEIHGGAARNVEALPVEGLRRRRLVDRQRVADRLWYGTDPGRHVGVRAACARDHTGHG